ncbi:hypothetical protein GDO86_016752 [Hymenochirus boettgeri]|uniref:VLRF1 domain-containing protein n=1 Tax=Hymenochirus boettgeri TaxID=247094 RepID=A0A8T2IKR7_9PIPI|nr:hypothetical protein GDO86_016752 [Hymenochirus boettgeri]
MLKRNINNFPFKSDHKPVENELFDIVSRRSRAAQANSLFELTAESPLLAGISVNSANVREDENLHVQPSVPQREDIGVLEVSERMCCSFCQCSFDSRDEQKEHYTLDWHRFNLKRRIKGSALLSEEDFQEKSQAGDVSSISGSDTECSDDEDLEASPRSGGESAPPSGQSERSQRVFFRNRQGQLISVFRCVLEEIKDTEVQAEDLMSCVRSLQDQPVFVILMSGGGHFAGAVYRGKEVLKHKTFHRYTVRAKRGTSQGLHDAQNRSHMPKSAGATLRRYNQAALIADIHQLLQSWSDDIREARGVYLRAPRSDRTLFMGRNSPISRKDPRVHGIPFATRRATFREVQRVQTQLFSMRVYDNEESVLMGTRVKKVKLRKPAQVDAPDRSPDTPNVSEEEEECEVLEDLLTEELTLSTLDLREFEVQPKKKRRKKKKNTRKDKESEYDTKLGQAEGNVISEPSDSESPAKPEEEMDCLEDKAVTLAEGDEMCQMRNALFTCCKIGDLEKLKQILENLNGCVQQISLSQNSKKEGQLVNERLPIGERTLLHVAASAGHGEVARLLMDAGWDPGLRDSSGQTPYSVCADKRTRNQFRLYREENPEKFNYSKSQIPGPVSEEVEVRKTEKKKAKKVQRKEREKQEKEERLRIEEEEAEKRRFAALSDREKRALAAEKRLAAQLNGAKVPESNGRRCWQCGESLLGKVPFNYLDFSFCTTRCLQEHRKGSTAKT